ncbi:phospholipid/cholesterol/gamma-HCH transport system substrate-binding protein [Chitinophaga rupis]|uniref:Phospholipid/cholesterol/gamma-HCH transport system substrate-binding protein n=1 Tax=Chitinophaga rupis TaxID=573321 RepID=A0A1H7RIQ3_9BACT|nr:MlaD family protein [Chitinophaga rupis]SEL60063.1 phospholipid/cholesterol/gamma-HCH transport system substrate-binding protein [Chitinophaga rupis]
MKETSRSRAVKVGIFSFLGLLIFALAVLVLGGQRKSFMSSVEVKAIFHDVGGLAKGNNVWYSGVKVGMIKKISFIQHDQIEVLMNIDKNSRQFIHKDVKAKVSTDGLVGNKIIALSGGSGRTPVIEDGDVIGVASSISTDEILDTLQVNNKNLVQITGSLAKLAQQLSEGHGTLGKLLNDSTVYDNLNTTMAKLGTSANNAQRLTSNLAGYTAKLQNPGTLANDLVTDTVIFQRLRNTATGLDTISRRANDVVSNLQSASNSISTKLNSSESPAGVLLNDDSAAHDLQLTLKNLANSTGKLDTNMEAVRHNFLLRGYFRRQEKQKKKEQKELEKKAEQARKDSLKALGQ